MFLALFQPAANQLTSLRGLKVDHCVFIHTNHKQVVGAKVAAYSMKRNSSHADQFNVKIIHTENYPWLREYDGKSYLRDGTQRVWMYDDLQSFTPLRFMPPKLMSFRGRALITDPDVFAINDIWELLTRDIQGKAIACRLRKGSNPSTCKASSVMLLDNQQLKHWDAETDFKSLFESKLDYQDWICLLREPIESFFFLEKHWNDFDQLDEKTRLLHNTKRMTQPWKTGLPIDWQLPALRWFPPLAWTLNLKRKLLGEYTFMGRYRKHPDLRQEQLFFGLLKECLEKGVVAEAEVRQAMAKNHIRQDAMELLENAPVLAPWPEFSIPDAA